METYTKLSNLIDDNFTVEHVKGFCYKAWDDSNHKMLVSDSPQKGYRKLYQVQTDKGIMDMGPGQMGNLLETISMDGKADIKGRTFNVKSNGKTGMEIRYYLNPVDPKPVVSQMSDEMYPE